MLREFKPKRNEPEGVEPHEIAVLFERGEFRKALVHCRRMGYSLDEFSDSLAKMAKKMIWARPGELLALVHTYNIDVGHDVPAILMSQFRIRDYHGFLKNVHRFDAYGDFVAEVETAISNLTRSEEAEAWRTKFARLSSNKPQSTEEMNAAAC